MMRDTAAVSRRLCLLWLMMLTCVAVFLIESVSGDETDDGVSGEEYQAAQNDSSPDQAFQGTEDTENGPMWNELDCSSSLRPFNPLIHKQKYRVAVHAIRGFDAAFEDYNQTFSEYLTATAGRRFDPPIEFEMIPTTFQSLFDAVNNEEVDFFYGNPGIYSCVGVEHGAQPLATIVSHLEVRGHEYDLDVFGGVIFTQAENDAINTIADLKDKVIGAGGISMIMAAQLQFYEMEMAGMSYVMDPKQVVFTGNQFNVVQGVLDGEFDVGFVRTDQIERHLDGKGNPLDPSVFKIIQPHIYVLDDGKLFPFLHSTDIYPEWPVAALDHVDKDVSEEVQEALLALDKHAQAARPGGTYTRCDTTPGLAYLAHSASVSGELAGFRTPRSYFEVRTMHEHAGFIRQNDKGDWKCTRADTVYDNIECPLGHYKLTRDDFNQSCSAVGLECREGYECYCKPCIQAFEVDVFQYNPDVSSAAASKHQGCTKMSLCGTAEQTKPATFRMIDNKKRNDVSARAVVHCAQETTELQVYEVPGSAWTYEFTWTENILDVGIFEIFFADKQIPESPIRVEVVPRNCNVDFPGQGKVPSKAGSCLCAGNTIDFGGKCVDWVVIVVVVCVGGFIFVTVLAYVSIRYKNRKGDEMWHVNVDELIFDDPAEIIGQGSFGVVLLAEYRGTKVAIKRAIKTSKKSVSGSKKSGSHSKKGSSTNAPKTVSTGILSVGTTGSGGNASLPDDSDGSPVDIESQHAKSTSSFALEGISRKSSDGFDLGFLEDYGQKTKSGAIFPWRGKESFNTSRFRESILNSGASSLLKTSCLARLCPWFDEQARREEEFVAEMRILSRLRHPCITTVMGAVITHTHDPMLVMEYMEYGSLHDLLRNETLHLSGDIALQMTRDVAQGLRYLHSSRPPILHGDMKARNILIDSRFRAKLCDFGLSTKRNRSITGTPYWLAPEYLRGEKPYDTMCDMYSMGIIFFEIYARRNPYEGEDFKDVLRHVCNKRINKRPLIPDKTPPKMVELMKKCWSPDPSLRPQAKDLDMALMEMTSRDTQPLTVEQQAEGTTRRQSGDMLYELFPRHVANALKRGEKVEPESHEIVTVVFSDIVDFTDISGSLEPLKVSNMLDRLYLAFDKIAKRHQVFKVETIGDAYMGVTNLEGNQDDNHVKQIAEFAVDVILEAGKILIDEEDPSLGCIHIRVGFHSGPVVSNVIGSLNPRYGLFGDTVNTSSRMETNSTSDRILCSERSYKLLKRQAPSMPVKKRGKIKVKGKGEMLAYWIGDELIQKHCQKQESTPVSIKEDHGKHVEFEDVPVEFEDVPVEFEDVPVVSLEPAARLPEYPLE